MSDINLRINGDSSGAQAAFREAGGAVGEFGDDVGAAVVKWQELANVAKKATELVVRFGIDAVKAYAESERVQKQLIRAAGDYADALGEQADALSRKYAVDDDIIKQSQVLLTQWGGVGAASEDATKAILNYAAATGQDAVSATTDLIRNVESGGVGLAKMGVHFTATGQKGHDLAAAIGAINAKFGGAAAADADSLIGQTHAAQLAFEDLQKNLGGAIAEMVRATGIVPKLTAEIRSLTDTLFTPTAQKQAESQDFIAQQVKYWEDITAGNVVGYKDFATKTQFTFEEAQAELAKWRAKLRPSDFNAAFDGATAPAVTGTTNHGLKTAGPPITMKGEYVQEETKQLSDAMAEQSAALQRLQEEQDKALADQIAQSREEAARARSLAEEGELRSVSASYDQQRKLMQDHLRNIQAQEQAWAQAGDSIGAALVNNISSQLQRLMAGEDMDAGEMMASIIADVLAVAGQIIGGVVGGYAGNAQLGAAVGGAVGGLAGSGVKALARSTKKARTYHEGGWVGDEVDVPRYHAGAWIGADEQRAILQTGERVLSRQEVGAMGGPAGVDAAARGVQPMQITVQTIDAIGVRAFFENDGGRGFFNALRTGRGSLAPVFGGG